MGYNFHARMAEMLTDAIETLRKGEPVENQFAGIFDGQPATLTAEEAAISSINEVRRQLEKIARKS
ncbi:MAG: hypothetical protein ACYS7Y_29575 [Planctomycetota bacterium]